MEITLIAGGLRIEVWDNNRLPPMISRPFEGSLTGRGLRLVAGVAERWGAESNTHGKIVWAEITGRGGATPADAGETSCSPCGATSWMPRTSRPADSTSSSATCRPTSCWRPSHTSTTSADAQAGHTAELAPHLRRLLEPVVERFAEARVAIKRQALVAARRGDPRTRLTLDLPASAADAAEE